MRRPSLPPSPLPSTSSPSAARTVAAMLADDVPPIAEPERFAPIPATRRLWASIADGDPDALVSQTPEWVDVLCRSGYEDATRAYWAADGSRMVLPLVRRRGNLPRALSPLT